MRPEYRRAIALRRGFGLLFASSLLVIAPAPAAIFVLVTRQHFSEVLVPVVCACSFMAFIFGVSALIAFHQAETGLKSHDMQGGCFFVSVNVVLFIGMVSSHGNWLEWLFALSLVSTASLFGLYACRRAALFVPISLAIVWYGSLLLGPLLVLASLAISQREFEVDILNPRGRIELQEIMTACALAYYCYLPLLSAIFFGWVWTVQRRQMSLHIVPILNPMDLQDHRESST